MTFNPDDFPEVGTNEYTLLHMKRASEAYFDDNIQPEHYRKLLTAMLKALDGEGLKAVAGKLKRE